MRIEYKETTRHTALTKPFNMNYETHGERNSRLSALLPIKSPPGKFIMSKNKKKKLKAVETPKAEDVKPWNALFRLPAEKRYRVLAFLVWFLGILIILWVFRA